MARSLPRRGGSLRHSLVAVNWTVEIGLQTRARSCRVFSSDARVRTSSGSFVYPDVSVVCGVPQSYRDGADTLTNPKVVIEVLSPSTAGYDRGKKFELYREISSLEEYVLVHTESPVVEHFARQADASWIFREYRGMETEMAMASIGCHVRLSDIYAGVLELPE